MKPIITSILDTDLYKLTMMQAIAHHYPHVQVEYEFINRNSTSFPPEFGQRMREQVNMMSQLRLDALEEAFLREQCYYLKPTFIDMLRGYKYDPDQVEIKQIGDLLSVGIKGPWYLTVLWEVPLLAIISELYYSLKGLKPVEPAQGGDGLTWTQSLAYKLRRWREAGCVVSEFGTRRRFSYEVQDAVVNRMAGESCCSGTSNVHLAMKHNLTPIGTMAHEWAMGHACLFGYRQATSRMLEAWVKVYKGELGVALPDTFTAPVFLQDFDTMYAKLFDGVRHDSGDWKWFTDLMVKHWKALRVDPSTKAIVYSDGLNTDSAIEIQKYAEGKVLPRFGIGTSLTNDVGQKPLNIVIKLIKAGRNGWSKDAVKLSDSRGKETGSSEAIAHCKYDLGLQ